MRFFDAHCDAVMHIEDGDFDFVAGKGRSHMDLPRLLAAGHCAQVFAIFAAASYYPGRDLRAFAERAIAAIHGWADASDGRMQVVVGRRCGRSGGEPAQRSGGAWEGALGAGASSPPPLRSSAPLLAIIGLEGADPLEGQAENLRHFHDLGVRLVIPAWDDNAFSGSSAGPGDGLTAEGFKLIELCQELGVMVDVSHASDAAFEQIRQTLRGPFVASHSNCRALSPAPRNLTDAQIRALADQGGVMGINLAPDFLSPEYLAAWDAVMAPAHGTRMRRRGKNSGRRPGRSCAPSRCRVWTGSPAMSATRSPSAARRASAWAATWTASASCPRASTASRATRSSRRRSPRPA